MVEIPFMILLNKTKHNPTAKCVSKVCNSLLLLLRAGDVKKQEGLMLFSWVKRESTLPFNRCSS